MSGINEGGIGQGKEFFANAINELADVATWEVGTANAFAEKYIAREEASGIVAIESQATG